MVVETLKIPSNLNQIHEVESLVDKVCADLFFGDEVYGDILISVTEAFNNAVIHGNKYNEDLSINISVSHNDNNVVFSIEDQGKGFDYSHLPNPIAPENLEKDCGRGIFLINNLADTVEFNERGNIINIGFIKND